MGASSASTQRKHILALCCQVCNYLSPFEASERREINISKAHLIAGTSDSLNKHKGRTSPARQKTGSPYPVGCIRTFLQGPG